MKIRTKTAHESPHPEPLVRIKEGIHRRDYPLRSLPSAGAESFHFTSEIVSVTGKRRSLPAGGRRVSLSLRNISASSIRLARFFLPLTEGLEGFLSGRHPENLGFLSNGYQSWSTARSFRLTERPFRSWLRMVSIISGNMANLPSNRIGDFSGEMFALIADNTTAEGICIGQGPPFNQFLYIRCVVSTIATEESHFELIYDFGRQTLEPGQSIELDGFDITFGPPLDLLRGYFSAISPRRRGEPYPEAPTGWSSWYYFYNRIGIGDLRRNLEHIREARLPLSVFQIDDGYQSRVGDWLTPASGFERMDALAAEIAQAGFTPGLWLAPFIADRSSRLVREHPGYLLRTEHGKAVPAGYNLRWPGKIYYALDVTNPRVEEYLRRVIRTVTGEWGFRYLKLDFLYAACLRGGAHNAMDLSRAQVMRRGVEILRDEAGDEVTLSGCGMPLSSGIGIFDTMRVGADTAPQWHRLIGRVLRSGAVEGVKNSLRNSFVRAPMNGRLWRNDPDCVMLRTRGSRLNHDERRTQINAAILSGGALFFSDDFSRLGADERAEAERILALHRECAQGEVLCLDLMEREFPELMLNSAGFLGLFNMGEGPRKLSIHRSLLLPWVGEPKGFQDVWSGERIDPEHSIPPHGSLLLRMLY